MTKNNSLEKFNSTFNKKIEFADHSGAVYSIVYDGEFIYSASGDKYVCRWNPITGTQDKFAIKFNNTPYSIQLFNNNSMLAVGLENGDLHFFDLIERVEVKFYKQHKSAIFSILENPFTKQIYTTDTDGNLAVWSTKDFQLQLLLPFDCGKIRRMAMNHNGSMLYLACQDGNIRVIETEFYNLMDEFFAHKDGVTSLAFHPKNSLLLLSGGKDAHLKFWDLTTNSELKSLPAHNFVIYDILFLSDKLFVTASRDKTIKIWDTEMDAVVQRIEAKHKGHRHSVNTLVKISDTSFASCSDDKRILVFSELSN
jgi:WD40 repeat protein